MPADRAASRRGSVARLTVAITLAAPLGLITGPIVARALGPSGRGEVASATTYGNLAWIVLGLGLPWAIGQRVAQRPSLTAAALGTAVRFSLVLVAPAAALGFLVVDGPLSHLGRAATIGCFILIALAPLNVFMNCQQSVLVAEGSLGAMATLRAAPLLVSAAAVIGLAAFGALGIGTYLAVTIGAGVLVFVLTWRHLRIAPRDTIPIKPLLSFGLRSFAGQAASYSNRFIDQAFLAVAVSSRQLGLYAVAATISSVPVGFGQALAARSFGEVARRTGDDRWAAAARYVRLALAVGIITAVGLAVTTPVMVPLLFGQAFRRSVIPLLILLGGTATLAAGLTGVRVLNAIDRPGAASTAELAALAVTLPGLAVAVPAFGIVGAAVVSTTAYWVRFLVMLRMLRREGMGSVRPRVSDVRAGASIIVGTLVRPLRRRAAADRGGPPDGDSAA